MGSLASLNESSTFVGAGVLELRLGHVHWECPLMEMGRVFHVTGPLATSSGPGVYSTLVRCQVGTDRAMVDSGSMQAHPVDGAEKPLRNDLTGSSL